MGWKNDRMEEPWPKAFEWVESHMRGTIVSYERHAWWRPAWFLERKIKIHIVDNKNRDILGVIKISRYFY